MYTVEYFPPGSDDTHVFFCIEKPTYVLPEDVDFHTLIVRFVPTNGGVSKGQVCQLVASCCLVGSPKEG